MAIPVPEKRIREFEDLGFGMIIHWGLYAQVGLGERYREFSGVKKEDYEKLTETFTASRFDAKKIVEIAKAAGMKYIVLTSRHIDGFSLYDTKGLNEFDAPHSACGRDLIREFVDACLEGGIKPVLYHATMDVHNPDFDNNFEKYLSYLRKSIEIVCSEYKGLYGIWLDGFWSKADADWQEDELYAVMRKYDPDIMILNNTGVGNEGVVGHRELDSVSFEQMRPFRLDREGMEKYVAAEMWGTMTNDHVWGVGRQDFNYHSVPWLIETLCACRKNGANYLLNVGPDAEGDITMLEEAMLRTIGEWIKLTGSAIYTARPTDIKCEESEKNFALAEDNKLYFYVHDLYNTFADDAGPLPGGGAGEKTFTGVTAKIKSVRWTDNGQEVPFRQDGDTLVIDCEEYVYGKNPVVRVAEAEF